MSVLISTPQFEVGLLTGIRDNQENGSDGPDHLEGHRETPDQLTTGIGETEVPNSGQMKTDPLAVSSTYVQ
jgi:hypothetical protein